MDTRSEGIYSVELIVLFNVLQDKELPTLFQHNLF